MDGFRLIANTIACDWLWDSATYKDWSNQTYWNRVTQDHWACFWHFSQTYHRQATIDRPSMQSAIAIMFCRKAKMAMKMWCYTAWYEIGSYIYFPLLEIDRQVLNKVRFFLQHHCQQQKSVWLHNYTLIHTQETSREFYEFTQIAFMYKDFDSELHSCFILQCSICQILKRQCNIITFDCPLSVN